MSTLKILRTRIKSIQSTKKITSAMKMVAASKLKRAQDRSEQTIVFLNTVHRCVQKTLAFGEMTSLPVMLNGHHDAPILVILFAGDRGLCGGFNANVIKEYRRRIQSLMNEKKNFYCLGIGKRAQEFIEKNYKKYRFVELETDHFSSYEDAQQLTEHLDELLEHKEIGGVQIVYTFFKNILSLETMYKCLVPYRSDLRIQDSDRQKNSYAPNEQTLFEPSAQEILKTLLKTLCTQELLTARLHSMTCEQAARMTAMDHASKNASELINDLKRTYNRTRQAIITKELIEIISGANATTS